MKYIFIISVLFFSGNIFSQKNLIKDSVTKEYTTPSILYNKDKHKQTNVSYYLNGELVEEIPIWIKPGQIKSVKIEKDKTNGKGSIYIETKKRYQPKLLSLVQLHEKFIETSSSNTIYFYDDKLVKENYEQFQVDEKYIHRIEIESVEKTSNRVAIQVVKIYSRSPENLKKGNNIIIRGR